MYTYPKHVSQSFVIITQYLNANYRIRVEEAIAVAQMQLSRHRSLVPLMRKLRKRHLQELREQKKLAVDPDTIQV